MGRSVSDKHPGRKTAYHGISADTTPGTGPPPDHLRFAGSASEWDKIEKKIGTPLPQDYKRLVNLYGLGSFGGHVCLLNPFVPELGTDSTFNFYRGLKYFDGFEEFQRESPEGFQPFPAFPTPGGLLPWGREHRDSGLLCWLTEGDPDDWGCIILDNDWSEDYHEYPTTVSGFLVGWLTQRIVISYYPPFPLP